MEQGEKSRKPTVPAVKVLGKNENLGTRRHLRGPPTETPTKEEAPSLGFRFMRTDTERTNDDTAETKLRKKKIEETTVEEQKKITCDRRKE